MITVRTFEVGVKPAPFNVGPRHFVKW